MNHKKVLRIMRENSLLCTKFHKKNRKYSSYRGTVGKIAENELQRQFKVEEPNQVYVSDVTEFKVKGEGKKVYLSPVMDLYNREIISYSISTSPTVALTNQSLIEAIEKLPKEYNLMMHTDQGFHYQHKTWVKLLEENNIKQSMSRKGNCLDNSPMENFFGILKQEMYYGEEFETVEELKEAIEKYIKWYNEKRIKENLGGLSPVEYREKQSLVK